ncbi:hypothetical protein EBR57_08550 [bacterium]|nr:hypothetical protein [bacterium]
MLNGQDKAKLLLSMLGDRATAVLSLLSPENATMLTSTIGDSPKASQAVMSGLITEIMDKVKAIRSESSPFSAADSLAGSLDSLSEESTESSFSSFGGSEAMGFGEDSTFGESENTEDTPSVPEGPRMRTPDAIAELLMNEKPQIAAFVMSRFEDSLRESVMDNLTYEYRDQILKLKVDRVPLSDSVFAKIYDRIVLAPPEEEAMDDTGSGFGPASSDMSSGGLFGF